MMYPRADTQRAKVAHSDLDDPWVYPGNRPLDADGPADVPFEPFDEDAIDRSIASRFHRIATRYATRTAIDDGETRLTYAEVRRIASHLARRVEIIVPAGRPVAVVLPNAALFPAAALACLSVGRPYVPIDLDYPAARNAEILREAGAVAAITQSGLSAAATLIPISLPTIDITESLFAAEEPPLDLADAETAAVILFTSGSTGRPKGICNGQSALLLRVAQFTNACHLNAEDRFILLSSPSTIAGVRDTFAALLNGAMLYITELRRAGIGGVQRVIRDSQISVYYSVPAVLRSLLDGADAKKAVTSLRIVRLGGDTTLETDLVHFRALLPPTCRILVGFGSTEAPTVFQWFARPAMGDGLRVPCGFPAPGIDFALVGHDGMPVRAGEIGELVVRSRRLALGLWQNGGLSLGPLESDPLDPAVRILHTGDLFRIRPDGMAESHGRNDRQIKIRGLRVDPGEVEAALRRCNGVADAAVLGRPQNNTEVALVGFAVLQPCAIQLNSKQLRSAVSAWLPVQKCPSIIHLVEGIPRLPSFKPDLAALAALDLALSSIKNTTDGPPTSLPVARPVYDTVKRAWTAVCGTRSVARDLSWEDAGGDSLKALQLLLHIEDRLGRRLSTDVLSAGMTPTRLCEAIERFIQEAPENGGTYGPTDGRTTVFLMPGIVHDDPGLARFRYALRDRIQFVLIGYPGWRETIVAKADFDAIVAAALDQILSRCGNSAIYLAGYSFGGFVAFATAHRLVELGRPVAFLGLLDTRRRSQFDALALTTPAKSMRLIRRIQRNLKMVDPGVCLRLLFRTVLALRAFVLLKPLADLCMRLGGQRAAVNAQLQLLLVLRSYAVRSWLPKLLCVPTFFFRSEEGPPDQPYDCGWGALCSPFSVVPISGDHLSIMTPPHAERLCASFLEALSAVPASPTAMNGAEPFVSTFGGTVQNSGQTAPEHERVADPSP